MLISEMGQSAAFLHDSDNTFAEKYLTLLAFCI